MITIGTVKFDFRTGDLSFAQALNGRWDAFFATSFEKVVEEVLEKYNCAKEVICIESLPIDLGVLAVDGFDEQFSRKLREFLEEYCSRLMVAVQPEELPDGVFKTSVAADALSTLCFFLLHGYFPFTGSNVTLSDLLRMVICEEAYRFKEFLEAYGHYGFLYERMVYQFTDQELEEIVRIVQPSESKFINLYVRVQVRTYALLRRTAIEKNEYRNLVWILVLAYLFAESRGRFNRKQLLVHTLQGVAAHLNFAFPELVRLVTEGIGELERRVEQLPELWSILKEIRQDIHEELLVLNGNSHEFAIQEAILYLRSDHTGESAGLLTSEHLTGLLSVPDSCRKFLSRLRETEIYRVVEIVIPSEKDMIISYARLLDKHKDEGTFSGRAGSGFRILKWEFIFAVLFTMPSSSFSRKQFVLSVLHRLAAHYNLLFADIVRLFYGDQKMKDTLVNFRLLPLFEELQMEWETKKPKSNQLFSDEIPIEELWTLLRVPVLAPPFLSRHTEEQIYKMVARLMPVDSEFIISYARLLASSQAHGFLEGKSGSEFRVLKWEFIFSCLFTEIGDLQQKKIFVFSVLQRLANHYNQKISDLLSYFYQEFFAFQDEPGMVGLKQIMQQLYEENMWSLNGISTIKQCSDEQLERWILSLFGEKQILISGNKEAYMEKWLVYVLNERKDLFRRLWRTGKLHTSLLFSLISRKVSLQQLWIRRIGDERMWTIYRNWLAIYNALRSRCAGSYFLQPVGEYLSAWMVELTARCYMAWSETEIIRFLAERIRKNIPVGYTFLLDKIGDDIKRNKLELDDYITEVNKKEQNRDKVYDRQNQIHIHNAGMVLAVPFIPRLFAMSGLLEEDGQSFRDVDSKVRAVFLLQYFVYGKEEEWAEPELLLNKLLVNWDAVQPLPRRLELTDSEKEMVFSLVDAIKKMWDKVKNTSNEYLQEIFFRRDGILSRDEYGCWHLKVAGGTFDMLLDYVPWSYSVIKLKWMESTIMVNWRL